MTQTEYFICDLVSPAATPSCPCIRCPICGTLPSVWVRPWSSACWSPSSQVRAKPASSKLPSYIITGTYLQNNRYISTCTSPQVCTPGYVPTPSQVRIKPASLKVCSDVITGTFLRNNRPVHKVPACTSGQVPVGTPRYVPTSSQVRSMLSQLCTNVITKTYVIAGKYLRHHRYVTISSHVCTYLITGTYIIT